MTRFIHVLLPVIAIGGCTLIQAAGVHAFTRVVKSNRHAWKVTGLVIDLHDRHLSLKVGLAQGLVGRTETLAGIARRYRAAAAINGSFFNAYAAGTVKNPDMSLVSDGQLLFKSDLGSMLGFETDNTPHLAVARYHPGGMVSQSHGRWQDWYAYWVNRLPTAANAVTVFTRKWGVSIAPMNGTSVVIEDGTVIAIQDTGATIPENGIVLHLRGETGLLARFKIGSQVRYRSVVDVTGAGEQEWSAVREAIGAGPRVLVHGAPCFDPESEGFSDPKILMQSGQRSAAGYTRDGRLFFITCPAARVADLGHILQALGCVEGMNLDGGASSGLWYRGRYLTTPGRPVSNALLVVPR